MLAILNGSLAKYSIGSFVSTWLTTNAGTSSSTQVKIPTLASGFYNCVVDWGDGNTSTITTYNDAAWTHTYSVAGAYQIQISGTFTDMSFNNGGDKLKLISVDNWGCFAPRFAISVGAFYGCTNFSILASDYLNLNNCTSMQSFFRDCTRISAVPTMVSWRTGNVSNMSFTFSGCTLFNQNISFWNTLSVNTFQSMFENATSFNKNLSSWFVINLVDATSMFAGVTLSTANYNAILASWGAQVVQSGVTFSGGNSHYDSTSGGVNGTAGRAQLVGAYLWTITDGGTP